MHGLIKELQINTTFNIKCDIDPDINSQLSEAQASHVFHIAHEALANVVRHSKGRKIDLKLNRENGIITLLVDDDGIGFVPPKKIKHGHHGLANMKKRVSLLSAKIKIDSAPGEGTSVKLTLPARSTSEAGG
jgi:signal transduction histidine kinase